MAKPIEDEQIRANGSCQRFRTSALRINRKLLPAKAVSFFYNGELGPCRVHGCRCVCLRYPTVIVLVHTRSLVRAAHRSVKPISYGLLEFASTSYINFIAPDGLAGVSQCVVSAMYLGIGLGGGSILTGVLFERIGSVWTYRVYAFSAFCLHFPFILLQRLFFGKYERREAETAEEYEVVSVVEETVQSCF